jgi:hypothetical protein
LARTAGEDASVTSAASARQIATVLATRLRGPRRTFVTLTSRNAVNRDVLAQFSAEGVAKLAGVVICPQWHRWGRANFGTKPGL